jgi:hypothetical protein
MNRYLLTGIAISAILATALTTLSVSGTAFAAEGFGRGCGVGGGSPNNPDPCDISDAEIGGGGFGGRIGDEKGGGGGGAGIGDQHCGSGAGGLNDETHSGGGGSC